MLVKRFCWLELRSGVWVQLPCEERRMVAALAVRSKQAAVLAQIQYMVHVSRLSIIATCQAELQVLNGLARARVGKQESSSARSHKEPGHICMT